MGYTDNRPQIASVKNRVLGVDWTDIADNVVQEFLDQSIAWVEDEATTAFNGISTVTALASEPENPGWECYDGNGTNKMTLRKRPVTSVLHCQVVTPILGYVRVYQPNEIKLYGKQGVFEIFTYKLAVEQALFNTLDYQAWGTIFPPLPKAVQVQYTYGFPQYDPVANLTTYDGGATFSVGDIRDPELTNWLKNLQAVAICDAAIKVLSLASTKAGYIQSQSFDGASLTKNPQAYAQQIQQLTEERDKLIGRRKRQFYMATIG